MSSFLFPGQGSQHKGMGGDLFDQFPEMTEKASQVLGYCIKTLCLHDPENKLDITQYTQAAIYAVNALHYEKLNQSGNIQVNYFMGHSLGEFNALQAAGTYSFEQGLALVKKRGELMHQLGTGAMAAILGLSDIKLNHALIDHGLSDIEIANYNTPQQLVISGSSQDIGSAIDCLQSDTVKCIKLNTSGAFHSPFMKKAETAFTDYLSVFEFHALAQPVISNVTARPYQQEEIRATLSRQMISPVMWSKGVEYLLEQGEQEFVEVGGADVLLKLVDKTQRQYQIARKFSTGLEDFSQAFC